MIEGENKGFDIERHLEDRDRLILGEESSDRLKLPFEKVKYLERGDVDIKRGPFCVSFGYEPLDLARVHPPLNVVAEGYEQWRSVHSFSFSRKDKNEPSIELDQILPQDFKVILKPGESRTCSADLGRKIISLRGDLANPKTIINLLHEIGHVQNYKNNTFETPGDKYAESHTAMKFGTATREDMEKVLIEERKAWAYALTLIRPFLDSKKSHRKDLFFRREDIQSYIHDFSLNTYSGVLAQEIEEDLFREFIDKQIKDLDAPDLISHI